MATVNVNQPAMARMGMLEQCPEWACKCNVPNGHASAMCRMDTPVQCAK